MKPITREEMYLAAAAGYDVTPPEPVTRKEKFLAKLAGMEVETPAVFTRQERFLEEAAVALSRSVIEPLEVTENGTYTAPDGVDGYSPVVVNVATASADLKYVTFMSYDGTEEYGKKAVAVGDDCADPIARGVFDTPTRESDVQYNYTFYGWAAEPNGGADANALKAVNEDKTVYANFSKAVRYYTITFYDDDGTTVLKSQNLAYGTMPSYTPTKEDHSFGGWTPDVVAVSGDASYTAVWVEKVTFATGSWDAIISIAESGQAKNFFAVGDTKAVTYHGASADYELTLTIVGFDHDDLSDGTGKAGISIMCMTPYDKVPWVLNSNTPTPYYYYANCNARTHLQDTTLSRLPADLVAGMKDVSKECDTSYTTGTYEKTARSYKIWIPSITELGVSNATWTELGSKYEYFPVKPNHWDLPKCKSVQLGTDVQYWSRSIPRSSSFGVLAPRPDGNDPIVRGIENLMATACYLCFGFCI